MARPTHRKHQLGVAREVGADKERIKHAVALGTALEDLTIFGVHASDSPLTIG